MKGQILIMPFFGCIIALSVYLILSIGIMPTAEHIYPWLSSYELIIETAITSLAVIIYLTARVVT